MILNHLLPVLFAFTVGVAFQLVNCWEIVRQGIGGLAQFFSIVSEPAVPAELAVWPVPAELGAKVGGEVLQLIAG